MTGDADNKMGIVKLVVGLGIGALVGFAFSSAGEATLEMLVATGALSGLAAGAAALWMRRGRRSAAAEATTHRPGAG